MKIAIRPPDLSPWRAGNTGLPYVWSWTAAAPGPRVLVQALTHGNELCGAIVLDEWLRAGLRPLRGELVLVFANVAAFERFDPAQPFASRCVDEDLNRVWADEVLQGPRDSVELRRARELRPVIDAADLLLDLHSMQEAAAEPLAICGTGDKSVALARALGQPATLMVDQGHLAGLRLIDRGGFADPASPRQALLVECGGHWEAAAVEVARRVARRLLVQQGLVQATAADRGQAPTRQRLLRVTQALTASSEAFRFAQPWRHLQRLPQAGTLLAEEDGQRWLSPYDDCVLVMPAQRPATPGQTMVRLARAQWL